MKKLATFLAASLTAASAFAFTAVRIQEDGNLVRLDGTSELSLAPGAEVAVTGILSPITSEVSAVTSPITAEVSAVTSPITAEVSAVTSLITAEVSQVSGIVTVAVSQIEGNNKVTIENLPTGSSSAGGEIRTTDLEPEVQIGFSYGVIQEGVGSALNNGTVQVNPAGPEHTGEIYSGPNAADYAIAFSKRTANLRYGHGAVIRFGAAFEAGVLGTRQYAGAFTPDPSLPIGSQPEDGVGFGVNALGEFGIWYIKDGVDTFIVQTAWNVDPCNGTGPSGCNITPNLGNDYQITFNIGYGNIAFSVFDPGTSAVIPVHRIEYGSTATDPNLGDNALRMQWAAYNDAGTADATIYASHGAIFIEGSKKTLFGPLFTVEVVADDLGNEATGAGSFGQDPEFAMLIIKNATTFNGEPNKPVQIRDISVGTTGPGGNSEYFLVVRVVKDTTTFGSLVTTAYDWDTPFGTSLDNGDTVGSALANSDSSISILTPFSDAALGLDQDITSPYTGEIVPDPTFYVTDGRVIIQRTAPANNVQNVDLLPYNLYLEAGEIGVVSLQSYEEFGPGGSVNFSMSVSWHQEL